MPRRHFSMYVQIPLLTVKRLHLLPICADAIWSVSSIPNPEGFSLIDSQHFDSKHRRCVQIASDVGVGEEVVIQLNESS